jgi:hypothetical protein
MVVGLPAMNATIEGNRIPGDFSFDPLGVGKKDFARMQVNFRDIELLTTLAFFACVVKVAVLTFPLCVRAAG